MGVFLSFALRTSACWPLSDAIVMIISKLSLVAKYLSTSDVTDGRAGGQMPPLAAQVWAPI